VQRELAGAVTESATLMGQLVWNASQRRDHAAAIAYLDQAIAAARQARDRVGEANAVLRKSYVALYGAKKPAAGLAFAHHAAITGRPDSSVIAGLAELHVAEAHAMIGDAGSCVAALGAAETHFTGICPDDPAGVLFCPSHHSRLAGSCWLSLGMPNKAEAALDTAHQLIAKQRKSTAVVLGNLALASIRQRNIDTAAAHLHQAISVVERTRGGGGLNLVFAAARELRPWRNDPAVQEVNDRLLTLMTAT
jgi:hypothetical protein